MVTKNTQIIYGKTVEYWKEEVKKDKAIEKSVLDLHEKGGTKYQIANILKLKVNEVKWIIKMDNCNLSYRKLGNKYNASKQGNSNINNPLFNLSPAV